MNQHKPWTIYVIQHSHTDVGYTERQEKIRQYHVNYIRQALQIVRDIESGARPDLKGYKWVCETYWPVESFLLKATDIEKEELAHAVKKGYIGLSGTYLNFGEQLNQEILSIMIKRITDYGQSIQFPVRSAMTADITGFGWGYSQVLADAGIENLITCIHTHHSMFPLWKKQIPFWWETPKGDRILTWSGEHYMFGNDLGLTPGIGGSYTIRDDHDVRNGVSFEVAEARFDRYLQQLVADGYTFPFVPVMVSGLPTDNGSPNAALMDFVNPWNEKHGERIRIQPATLDDFFADLRAYAEEHPEEIETFRGDWPDWWTDGSATTPMHVQIFREAQRVYTKVKLLDPACEIVSKERLEAMEYELALFAEHTWGYHSSVTEPWNPFVQELGCRKEAYAANASSLAHTALYDILEARGDALLRPNCPMKFELYNPNDFAQTDYAELIMEGWNISELKNGFEVMDESTGTEYEVQMVTGHRGVILTIPVTLQPKQQVQLTIKSLINHKPVTAYRTDYVGSDRMLDIIPPVAPKLHVTPKYMESQYVRLEWEIGAGITKWIDKTVNQNLLRADRNHHAFSPVYNVTRAANEFGMYDVRRKMGRNRRGPDAITSVGTLVNVDIVEKGALYAKVRLTYSVNGCSHYSLLVTLYSDRARIDVAVRMHKESVWDPENLYISLPFGSAPSSPQQELWIEKTGASVRPRIDQLPGSLADFYCVDEGVAYISEGRGIAIAMPDTPLIQIGSLDYEDRLLSGHPELAHDPAHLYSWPMNNYWETNFKATLGGFYEFRYYVTWGEELHTPESAMKACRSMNAGILSWRTNL
ncbi:glycoside hydrolase [Paenibacillus sp. FSL R7-0048]|uniref:glycoside hydrolase family 38 N-terminal domain-containing protein n=1 Tax=unclassified Paenibacillus TaxID=185978 RepID=UPI0030EF8BA6